MNNVVKQFEVDMKVIRGWASTCKTGPQLKNVIKFFDKKRKAVEPHCTNWLSNDSILAIGYAIGTVMVTIEYKIEELKKQQLTIKNLHSK